MLQAVVLSFLWVFVTAIHVDSLSEMDESRTFPIMMDTIVPVKKILKLINHEDKRLSEHFKPAPCSGIAWDLYRY